ncbi:hypothetical protein PSPO01_05217 [Paraphaeosphaeria sporulosa]
MRFFPRGHVSTGDLGEHLKPRPAPNPRRKSSDPRPQSSSPFLPPTPSHHTVQPRTPPTSLNPASDRHSHTPPSPARAHRRAIPSCRPAAGLQQAARTRRLYEVALAATGPAVRTAFRQFAACFKQNAHGRTSRASQTGIYLCNAKVACRCTCSRNRLMVHGSRVPTFASNLMVCDQVPRHRRDIIHTAAQQISSLATGITQSPPHSSLL